jgi:hypothetical protein
MKKALTVTALLAGAVSVYSQGAVSMNDYNGNFSIQIFTSSSAAASTVPVSYGGFSVNEQQGNTANPFEANPGTMTYTGTPLAAGYAIQLLAGAGLNDPLASLSPVGNPITTWYSGDGSAGLGGFWNSSALAAIPGTTTTASVAIAAWNTEGGTVNSLAGAQAAGDPWGISSVGYLDALGSGLQTPPNLPAALTGFSLGASIVPEPSTIALGVIGASAFLMRLRRKQ